MAWRFLITLACVASLAGTARADSTAREAVEHVLASVDEDFTDLAAVSDDPPRDLLEIARDSAAHAYVRQRAIFALGHYATAAIRDELTRFLFERLPEVRQSAAYVIGRYFGKDMPDDVLAALRPVLSDPDQQVRKQAVRGLSFVQRLDVVWALNAQAPNETDPSLKDFILQRAHQLAAALLP